MLTAHARRWWHVVVSKLEQLEIVLTSDERTINFHGEWRFPFSNILQQSNSPTHNAWVHGRAIRSFRTRRTGAKCTRSPLLMYSVLTLIYFIAFVSHPLLLLLHVIIVFTHSPRRLRVVYAVNYMWNASKQQTEFLQFSFNSAIPFGCVCALANVWWQSFVSNHNNYDYLVSSFCTKGVETVFRSSPGLDWTSGRNGMLACRGIMSE